MPRSVVVTGMGVVSPLGFRLEALFDRLCAGESALAPIAGFDPKGLSGAIGGEIADLNPAVYLGKKNYRPLNRAGLLSVIGAQFALERAGLDEESGDEREIGLVLGTMFCSVNTIASFDRTALVEGVKYAKPLTFANTVINAAAGQTAIWRRLRGLNSTVAAGATSGVQALAQALGFIRGGRADILAAGGVEEFCFESFLGFHRFGLLAGADGDTPRPAPFGPGRNGFALSEGSAFLVLEGEESARSRGAAPLAEVLGSGSGYDASRGADRRQAVAASARVMRRALETAGLAPDDLDCVCVAASGLPDQDAFEAEALAEVFGPAGAPVMAIKGLLGEALGASGAFQAAALIQAMRTSRLPGAPGSDPPDPALPELDLSAQTRELPMRFGLVNALGFDGGCCAMVFGLPGEAP